MTGRTAASVGGQRIVVLIPRSGYRDEVLAWGQSNIEERILTQVIIVRGDRCQRSVSFATQQAQVGVGIARVIESFRDSLSAEPAGGTGGNNETVEIHVAIIGAIHVLPVNDISIAGEDLFRWWSTNTQTSIRPHDCTVGQIVGVGISQQVAYLVHGGDEKTLRPRQIGTQSKGVVPRFRTVHNGQFATRNPDYIARTANATIGCHVPDDNLQNAIAIDRGSGKFHGVEAKLAREKLKHFADSLLLVRRNRRENRPPSNVRTIRYTLHERVSKPSRFRISIRCANVNFILNVTMPRLKN